MKGQAGSRGGSGAVGAVRDDSIGLAPLGNGSETESIAMIGGSVGHGSVDTASGVST